VWLCGCVFVGGCSNGIFLVLTWDSLQVAELLLGLTHVRLDGEGLTLIDNLDCFSSCTHLYPPHPPPSSSPPPPSHPPPPSYLQRNFLTLLSNLDHLSSLTFLQLSRNRIQTLQGIAALPSLVALDVDHNQLADVATRCVWRVT